MKQTTFFLIILIVLIIIGIIGKLIRKESFKPVKGSFFDNMYRTIWILWPLLMFAVIYRYNYFADIAIDDRIKNHIPCIEGDMKLSLRSKGEEIWRSKNYDSDSIKHEKRIDIDMNGIHSETDYIINVPLDKTLVLETRLQGMIFSRKTNHRLLATANYSKRDTVEKIKLDSTQADSVIKAWNYPLSYDCRKINK